MRLLAFEEKKNFKIDVLEGMRLLSNAWNSVLKATIKNCCKKVNFTQPEDNLEEQETEDTTDRKIVGKWERLQAGGLSPETYGFTDYSASDEGLITRETITESSTISELTADEDGEEVKEGDEDISVEDVQPAVLSPIEALAAIRKLDRYLRSSEDNQKVLHSQTKIQQHVWNKAVTKTTTKKLPIFMRESKYCTIPNCVVTPYCSASIPFARVLRANIPATIFHDLFALFFAECTEKHDIKKQCLLEHTFKPYQAFKLN